MATDNGNRVLPNNLTAEESLLGACLLSPAAMETAKRLVTPSDFYKPGHSHIFYAMQRLWDAGTAIDPVTVANVLEKDHLLDTIGGAGTLVTLQTTTPATTNAKRYANIVVEMATYRRAIEISSSLMDRCFNLDGDPSDIMEAAITEFASAGVRIDDIPADLWQLDEFLDRPDMERPVEIIPGIIRIGHRIIVVAGEGVGKTVLFRQIAILAAQGIHPLRFTPITPVRSLVVDLENPEDSVTDTCNPIREKVWGAIREEDYDPERAWLWHRPQGINLRNRTDRIAFESVIAHTNPDLVCLGPLYKAYEVNARENDELAAREVMSILDDLRTRYKFGLLMEHHAPKESGGSKRKMMPYGSSFWLRWPEMGISLQPEGQGLETLVVGRWRGDRLENDWPIKLHRSPTWPWQGEFDIPRAGMGSLQAPRNSPPPSPIPENVSDFMTSPDDDDEDYLLDDPF